MLSGLLSHFRPAGVPGSPPRKLTKTVHQTGHEVSFSPDEFIVSKTDLTGRITYANDVFLRVAAMSEEEAIGAPHSIIRHPDMPRSVFKFLWTRIADGHEVFAYVKNLACSGDHYWVFAHVTPSYDSSGMISGYHSNRRVPSRKAVDLVEPIYAELLKVEQAAPRKQAPDAGLAHLTSMLNEKGMSYDQFVFSF